MYCDTTSTPRTPEMQDSLAFSTTAFPLLSLISVPAKACVPANPRMLAVRTQNLAMLCLVIIGAGVVGGVLGRLFGAARNSNRLAKHQRKSPGFALFAAQPREFSAKNTPQRVKARCRAMGWMAEKGAKIVSR